MTIQADIVRAGTVGTLILTLGAAVGCVTNPATGRRQFNFMSRDDEIALGLESGPQLTQSYGGEVPSPAIAAYVTSVGRKLVEQTESDYRDLPWKFTLLNSDVINAFALPGGQVFVSRALAERFTSEAELAAVLGHEVGHVTAEHADRAVGTQLGLSVVAAGASIFAGDDQTLQLASQAVVGASGVYALTFSREQENEADELGMRYMVAAGYDPVGMLRVMETLAQASKGSGQWEILATHPDPQTRVGKVTKRINERYKSTQGDPKYGLYEPRYQSEFLARIRSIPPAPKSEQSRLDPGVPGEWCAVCAARSALAQAPVDRQPEAD